jgi:acyl-homoserine lactone acylase PvdQ
LLDRQLIPRIEQLAARTDITDIDEVVEQLRLTHKDYQRKQVAALRQMVTKAVQVVQQKGSARREAQLQVSAEDVKAPVTVAAASMYRCWPHQA